MGAVRPAGALPGDWRYQASCSLATAEEHYSVDRTRIKAIARCVACPVIAQCREWAIDNNEQFGIWGGMTPEQRKRVRSYRR